MSGPQDCESLRKPLSGIFDSGLHSMASDGIAFDRCRRAGRHPTQLSGGTAGSRNLL